MEILCVFANSTAGCSVAAYSYYYARPDSSRGSGGRARVL